MSYPLFDKDEHWHKPEQAFLTDDHRTILRFAVEALMSGKGAVLVTLVEIRGGAARPLGAQMVVREDGRYCGFVSGGCVEAAAAFEALEMMGSGRDREIRYGEGSPWFDIVLPCGGGITLTLHKLRSAQPLLAVLNRLEQRKPAGLRYDPQAQSLVCLPTQTRTGWNLNGFEVGFRPCVRLMIYGRSLEAQATASLAAATGYDSHIFDLFPASASAQIDTDTAVILLLTPWPLATILTAPLAGRLVEKVHPGLLGGIGMAIFATGLFTLYLLPPHPAEWNIIWRMALCGMGFGLFQTPNNVTIVSSAPTHRSGGASGMLGTARLLGQTLGTTLVALLFRMFAEGHRAQACLLLAIFLPLPQAW